MDYNNYKKYITEKFSKHFTISHQYRLQNLTFDFAAIYNERNIRYFASKKIELDAIENNEFCFFTYIPNLLPQDFILLSTTLESSVTTLVQPTPEHMSTYITCIIITEKLENYELISQLKNYKYSKSFLFNLKGWAKIRFIIVDLVFDKIYSCKEGDSVKMIYDYT
ncbi:MAG: hypothetical protein MJA31_09115 [Clostridia bacterium]|nr:hypothetical protein [Clostridia bacterium]